MNKTNKGWILLPKPLRRRSRKQKHYRHIWKSSNHSLQSCKLEPWTMKDLPNFRNFVKIPPWRLCCLNQKAPPCLQPPSPMPLIVFMRLPSSTTFQQASSNQEPRLTHSSGSQRRNPAGNLKQL